MMSDIFLESDSICNFAWNVTSVPHKEFGLLQAQPQFGDKVVQLSVTDLDIDYVVPVTSEK